MAGKSTFILTIHLLVLMWATSCDHGKNKYLEASALVSSCLYNTDMDPNTIGSTMTFLFLSESDALNSSTWGKLFDALFDCYRSAKNCEDVHSCTYANSEQLTVCEPSDYGSKCSGDVLVHCGDYYGWYWKWDCESAGLICGEDLDGAACGEATCDAPIQPCDGDIARECKAGVEVITDCSIVGGTCEPESGGDYYCVGTGEECSELDMPDRCEGNIHASCRHGNVARRDCTQAFAGGRCIELEENVFCGFDNECDPDASEECADGVITLCFLGKKEKIDCRALGYYGCSTFSAGRRAGAFCMPPERDACEKFKDIQKEICEPADKCIPCACILRNEGWEIPYRMGMPDWENASCKGPGGGGCLGPALEDAEQCLAIGRKEPGDEGWEEWRDRCDPRYAFGVWLFDDNQNFNPAFPEVCRGDW